jgi:hypothetical protein
MIDWLGERESARTRRRPARAAWWAHIRELPELGGSPHPAGPTRATGPATLPRARSGRAD